MTMTITMKKTRKKDNFHTPILYHYLWESALWSFCYVNVYQWVPYVTCRQDIRTIFTHLRVINLSLFTYLSKATLWSFSHLSIYQSGAFVPRRHDKTTIFTHLIYSSLSANLWKSALLSFCYVNVYLMGLLLPTDTTKGSFSPTLSNYPPIYQKQPCGPFAT